MLNIIWIDPDHVTQQWQHKSRNFIKKQQENDEQFEIDISDFVPSNGVGTRFNVIQL